MKTKMKKNKIKTSETHKKGNIRIKKQYNYKKRKRNIQRHVK